MLSTSLMTKLLITIGIAEILFWTYFFIVENKNPKNSDVYLGFERSFPVPDLLWLTPCCFIGAIGLSRDQSYGVFCTILSGCSLLFISLLDISFNVQNQGYTKSVSDAVLNGMMNLFCFCVGILFMAFGWRHFVD
jgi:hypothetical protein